MKNLWWGYIHSNGSIQVKRFFGQLDIDDANESPFVDRVYGPWKCATRAEAIAKIKEMI